MKTGIYMDNMSTSWISEVSQYLFLISVCYLTTIHCKVYDSEVFVELVRSHGYPVEEYEIRTQDNYITSLYRIPHGLNDKRNGSNKSVVLLIHGLGGTPHYWSTLGPEHAPAYFFADRGFDVWIFCARGSTCASKRKHIKYDWNRDPEYWDFSFHHTGFYDLTASMDFVISTTNQSKLFLIGHAGGNTAIFTMCSEKPEYNDKIKIAVSYAPSLMFKSIDYPLISFLASMVDILKGLLRILGFPEMLPGIQQFRPFLKTFCRDPQHIMICKHASSLIGGHASVLIDYDRIIPNIVGTLPPRLSAGQVFHFLENIRSGNFQKYNYGTQKNLKTYGQKTPPLYDLRNCVAPMALFVAPNDRLCSEKDAYLANALLPNVSLNYKVPFKEFGHLDFLFAENATNLVYEQTYLLFKEYDKEHSAN